MTTRRQCPECGAPIPEDISVGGCPACALRGALELSGAPVEAEVVLAEKPGDKIGPYKLLQIIGEGGMGTVWLAEQEEPIRRRVALKIIKLGMDTKQVIGRFKTERQALALMDHPNIAKVFDAGATNTGRPYFVMELVNGRRATDYCDQHSLSTRARLELFVKICQTGQQLSEPLLPIDGAYSAQFSPDGKQVLTAEVHSAQIWDISPSATKTPGWLPQLTEAFSGNYLNDQGFLKPTTLDRGDVLNQLRQRLNQEPDDDGWIHWGRWLLVELCASMVATIDCFDFICYEKNFIAGDFIDRLIHCSGGSKP